MGGLAETRLVKTEKVRRRSYPTSESAVGEETPPPTVTRPKNAASRLLRLILLFSLFCFCLTPNAKSQDFLSLFDEVTQVALRQHFLFVNPDSLHSRNTLYVWVECSGEIKVSEEKLSSAQLGTLLLHFISNPDHDPELPVSPQEATVVVDFNMDIGKPCPGPGGVVRDIFLAYGTLRDQKVVKHFGRHFIELDSDKRTEIEKSIPYRVVPYPVVWEPDTGISLDDLPKPDLPSCPKPGEEGAAQVSINGAGAVTLEGDQVSIVGLEERIAAMLSSREAGDQVCFYVDTERDAPYARFIEVLDVLNKFKLEALDMTSQQMYGKPYEELEKGQKIQVLEQVAFQIRLDDPE